MSGCTICGRPVDRGKFCPDCEAALERARNETISRFQLIPTAMHAGAGAVPEEAPRGRLRLAFWRRRRSVDLAAALAPVPVASMRTRIVWAVVVFAVLLGAGLLVAVVLATRDASLAARAPEPPKPIAVAPRPVVAPKPAEPPVALKDDAVDLASTAAAPAKAIVPPSVARSDAHKPVEPPRARVATPPPPAVKAVAPAPARVEEAPAPTPPAAETSVAQAPAPAAEPANRWARMDQALRGCAEQALFTRILCEQKVRFAYCEGQWGQNSRCPGNPPLEHGQ